MQAVQSSRIWLDQTALHRLRLRQQDSSSYAVFREVHYLHKVVNKVN